MIAQTRQQHYHPNMSKKRFSFSRIRDEALSLWDEERWKQDNVSSGLRKFVHFWVLVWKSFSRNRCPVRAASLAYATLLTLVPVFAVVVSITSTFLKKEGVDRIDHFIEQFVASVTPPDVADPSSSPPVPGHKRSIFRHGNSEKKAAIENQLLSAAELTATNNAAAVLSTNTATVASTNSAQPQTAISNLVATTRTATNSASLTNQASSMVESDSEELLTSTAQDAKAIRARKEIARRIHGFIQNTRSGALGVTGSVVLIFAAISLLSRVESTFNDIWGMAKGRAWYTQIVLYWGVLSLAPILIVVAVGLANGAHLDSTRQFVTEMPYIGGLVFKVLPVVLLCLTFTVFYVLMPNTKVHFGAGLVGGVIGGLLFHTNNLVSVLYVSRIVSNSKIYGGLAVIPVFMIGLYLAWWILLFGAQVAYAYQNRVTYLEERQVENINQRGREFVALRLMTLIAERYLSRTPPLTVSQMAEFLCVPSRLIRQIMEPLVACHLIVETAGADCGYVPARPMETITCHDILMAMRAAKGEELATRDEPVRQELYGEFARIQEAERHAASTVTMLALARRAQTLQLEPVGKP
jgi:membrane protein